MHRVCRSPNAIRAAELPPDLHVHALGEPRKPSVEAPPICGPLLASMRRWCVLVARRLLALVFGRVRFPRLPTRRKRPGVDNATHVGIAAGVVVPVACGRDAAGALWRAALDVASTLPSAPAALLLDRVAVALEGVDQGVVVPPGVRQLVAEAAPRRRLRSCPACQRRTAADAEARRRRSC